MTDPTLEEQMATALKPKDQPLEDAIEAERDRAAMTYSEIKAAVSEAANANQDLQQRNLTTLGAIRTRKQHLAEIRHKLEAAEAECNQHEIEIVSSIKATIYAQASMDADELVRGVGK